MRKVYIGILVIIVSIILLNTQFGNVSFPSTSATPTSSQQVKGASDHAIEKGSSIYISKVIDGDTVETKDGKKIRYIGINAPEISQPYGKEAADFNRSLVLGKTATIVFDKQQKDEYGRLLGYVYVGSTFVNLEIAKKGWAVAENISPDMLHQDEFVSAEQTAKHTCQGLWSDLCMPVSQSCIKITNLHYDVLGDDSKNLNGEWVEITNSCPNTIDLSGWLLKDSSAKNAYIFNAISLESGAHILLHSGCGSNTLTDLYWQCTPGSKAIWNNSGDEAMLFDTHGKLLSVYKY